MKNSRIAVLISGRGSNLKSLIDNAQHYDIIAVLSNNADAKGLELARQAGIETIIHHRSSEKDRPHRQRIYHAINRLQPDYVALAGFMEIIGSEFVRQWEGRLINIHPSLLPDFKGLNTHARALQRFTESDEQLNRHGCSVHYVDVEVDTGPVIAQASCAIMTGDTEQILADRVLEYEHKLFPWVINQVSAGAIRYDNKQVKYSQQVLNEAEISGFALNKSR
ncbi:MAG: phosphoribosylglycinamide formyltransferase [Gammaproteobacteria bacterium]|nr:phosphoribosylglycinamide formyltransferase [Gammaproteobacteria bacterium]